MIDNSDVIEHVMNSSAGEALVKALLRQMHTKRLDNLLKSNGRKRYKILKDGNCFINAVLHQLPECRISCTMLREQLWDHLSEHEARYCSFLTTNVQDRYAKEIEDLKTDGHWNNSLTDCLPLAIANMFHTFITIYSSKLGSPVIEITPTLGTNCQQHIYLAYVAYPGQEHYDSCVPYQYHQQVITGRQQ